MFPAPVCAGQQSLAVRKEVSGRKAGRRTARIAGLRRDTVAMSIKPEVKAWSFIPVAAGRGENEMMKRLPLLVAMSLGIASASCAAPDTPQPAASGQNAAPRLWLTVRFDTKGIPFSRPYGKQAPAAATPDAEISALTPPNTRFQQQFTCPTGQYGIAGVIGDVSGGQYPLSIRITGGPTAWCETRINLILDKPYTWGVINGYVRGFYTVTLSHAPEWREMHLPFDVKPKTVPASAGTTNLPRLGRK